LRSIGYRDHTFIEGNKPRGVVGSILGMKGPKLFLLGEDSPGFFKIPSRGEGCRKDGVGDGAAETNISMTLVRRIRGGKTQEERKSTLKKCGTC
jgi:hypothetical protein